MQVAAILTSVRKRRPWLILGGLLAATCLVGGAIYVVRVRGSQALESKRELDTRLAALLARTRKQMVFVEGGRFEMGDFGAKYGEEKLQYSPEINDNVLHEVTLDSFSMSAYKITYEDYDVFSDATGRPRISTHKRELPARLPRVPAGLSWQAAHDYCQWLGSQLNVPMDLPTEAQWEYAARGRGRLVLYATDNGKIDDGRNVPSFDQKEARRQHLPIGTSPMPMEVGLYPPNPLGLYDMVTNGYEWVQDWYAESYESAEQKNPRGPGSGSRRVMRGYELRGGDGLSLLSFTFVRRGRLPQGKLEKDAVGENPDLRTTARCAAVASPGS
ncbi:SUMF1/EgtB/PvdO family nonheme iron enzyme [Niveibacterium sp. SC-1]|uniref:formylglycine-generating enzyme family protein n=1 Tax=Niveibacterium sp. SC-1 TaxID=3135646 RepID=UPI00311E63EA